MTSTYTSDILYHLVGRRAPLDHERNFRTLCEILRSGQLRHHAVEGLTGPVGVKTGSEFRPEQGEPVSQTVTCFCDIPLNQLYPIHTGKYGYFGLGVDRRKVASRAGRPVIYLPESPGEFSLTNPLARDIYYACQSVRKLRAEAGLTSGSSVRTLGTKPSSTSEAFTLISSVLEKEIQAHVKIFRIDLTDEDPQNFYMEREWRVFGNFALADALRIIVVSEGYAAGIKAAFPQYVQLVREISAT